MSGQSGPVPCVLFVDANVLLDSPDPLRWRTDLPDVTVLILERVAGEVRGLTQRPDATGAAARRALLGLESLRQRGPSPPALRGAPRVRFLRGADASSAVDTHLAAEAATFARRAPQSAVAVVSRDQGVWECANRAGIYCVLVRGTFDNAAFARAIREARAALG